MKKTFSPPPPSLRKSEYIVATAQGFYPHFPSLKEARHFLRVRVNRVSLKNPTIYRVDRRLTRVA